MVTRDTSTQHKCRDSRFDSWWKQLFDPTVLRHGLRIQMEAEAFTPTLLLIVVDDTRISKPGEEGGKGAMEGYLAMLGASDSRTFNVRVS